MPISRISSFLCGKSPKRIINNRFYKWSSALGVTPSKPFIDDRFISNTGPLGLHVQKFAWTICFISNPGPVESHFQPRKVFSSEVLFSRSREKQKRTFPRLPNSKTFSSKRFSSKKFFSSHPGNSIKAQNIQTQFFFKGPFNLQQQKETKSLFPNTLY